MRPACMHIWSCDEELEEVQRIEEEAGVRLPHRRESIQAKRNRLQPAQGIGGGGAS